MDDPPITPEELYRLHQIRVGKEPTRAVRSEMYSDPARFAGVRFEKEKVVIYGATKITNHR